MLCKVRKYRLALGTCARRKFRDPISPPSAFEFTTSFLKA
jgi:hypothetical protein